MYQIYVIVNKINGKMYVGCTERKLQKRWQSHVDKAANGSLCTLHKAIRKYNPNNFDIRMINEYPTRKSMLDGEISWIAYFNTFKSHYGYNDTPGGDGGNTNGGKKFSEKWKTKISKSLAGKPQIEKRRFSTEIEKKICKLYIDEEKSTYTIGKMFNCYRSTIINILNRNNIKMRKSNYTGHFNGRNIFSIEKELEICNEYLKKNISRSELAKQYNCGKTTVRGILLRNNIQL